MFSARVAGTPKDQPMNASPTLVSCGPHGKTLRLSVKQRVLLHRLLHRDLRKCSTSALAACEHRGWTLGPGGGHGLTTQGRRIAELSEMTPAERTLELDLS